MKSNESNNRNPNVVQSVVGLGVNALALLSTAAALVVSLTAGGQAPADKFAAELAAPTGVPRLAGYYAAPTGSASGNGSLDRPWDLQTALQKGNGAARVVRPGDTIWLRGGIYRGSKGFHSSLMGAPNAPITVRAYPGERAVIDLNNIGDPKATFFVLSGGGWTNYRDFEVMNSITARKYYTGRPRDYTREEKRNLKGHPSGFMIHAPHTKFINLIVHDNIGSGLGFWENASDSEIYGCLIYNNGVSKEEHGIYSVNKVGAKKITDNIIFNQTGMGISIHKGNPREGTPNLKGFDIEGNISFNNGSVLPAPLKAGAKGRVTYYNILVGMGSSVENLRLVNNFTYYSQPGSGRVQIGTPPFGTNRNLLMQNNYFVESFETVNWEGANIKGNIVASDHVPTETKVYVRPNKYEPGRANIVVYNWKKQNTVVANIAASGLKIGQRFEVRNAQDFFAPPVLTGTYNGQPITLPMTGLSVARHVSSLPQPPQPTGVTFNAFIVRPAQAIYKLS